MTTTQPPITATTHPLPFHQLSPRDFERLCLWLVEREGYERAEHLGAAGSEQGRDIIASLEGELWAFQCKRVQRFGPKSALVEVDKVLGLPRNERPVGLVFIVTCDVSANTRRQVRKRCAGEMECHFWTGTELDAKIKQHPDIVEEFFQADQRSHTERLNEYLARAVVACEARMYRLLAPPQTPPNQPYKFLYAFEIEDTDIFFGRDAASEALLQTILRDRLTILHAKSGAGKTSLLNAGLSPRLIREGCLPVYARAYEDPVLAIKRTIAPPSEPWPELLPELSLHEFLRQTCARLSRQTKELVVILDQFEEFFIFWPEQGHRQPFIDSLADCYEDKSLPVRFIIALRKDYYSDLADFQGRIPTVLYNEYRLDTMTREEAQTAVVGPVAKLDRPVTYEQSLLDALLDDLARGGMELPHLQIVCTRLYEALAEEETAITLASYEEFGRTEGVLGDYLNGVLSRLPGRGETIAREVLKELVSSEATKRVQSYGTLAARVEAKRDELEDILARLVNARLLRRDEVAGDVVYEMAHEHLIEEIGKWIDQSDLEFKQVEELLVREVANWRVHGTLIPRDRLGLLYAQREQFGGLDDEVWECILRSAAQASFAFEDWAKLAGGVVPQSVVKTLTAIMADASQSPVPRAQAGDVLARLGDPRPGVGIDPATGLPDIVWCQVPAGPFLMGSGDDDEVAWDNEKPQHLNETIARGYSISRYPVTDAQFAAFVEAGGYREQRYWTKAGWKEKEQSKWAGPGDYGEPYNLPNHPVVGVSWYEAVAFCRWLTEQLHQNGELNAGKEITLPTESRWEKAARSTDGRVYPWGNDPDPNRANHTDTGISTTSAVGCFPGGASSYEVEDLSGNVLEWCLTRWEDDYRNYQDDNGLAGDDRRVLRGGSFRGSLRGVRSACRYRNFPQYRVVSYGFRVVAAPFSQSARSEV
jgi:formylglycine-generating enzyme required for sulfatase activity